ncbi:hypothetical protein ASE91_13615 [Sphingomonas sp. Leaf62]|nr:hypothetical protein ASE91_13615 [Sphingomonas sp. Leaf62]
MGQLTENGSKMLPRRMSDEARKEIVRLLGVTSTDARFWIDTRTIELQSFVRRLVWLHSNTNGAIDGPGLSLVDNRLKLTDPEDEALYQIAEAA